VDEHPKGMDPITRIAAVTALSMVWFMGLFLRRSRGSTDAKGKPTAAVLERAALPRDHAEMRAGSMVRTPA
jgi:hypothetical protein